MSPAMDSMHSTSTSTLYNVPQLAKDGGNWITYKERVTTAVYARGLRRYLEGRAVCPAPLAMSTATVPVPVMPGGSNATEAEIEAHEVKIDEYHQKDSLVKQQLFSTITDRVLLRVQKVGASSAVWAAICKIHEDKSDLVQIDLRRRLSDTRCEESADIRNHFGELLKLREALAGMGTSLSDTDFTAIIMSSLPESYRPILSSMSAGARIAKTSLTPYDLISFVTEEYEHHQLMTSRVAKKSGNSAFSADAQKRKGSAQVKGASPDTVCYNCNRKGHFKSDCWSSGGGKEGQGPNRDTRRGAKSPRQTASIVAVPEVQKDFAFALEEIRPTEIRCAIIDSGATSHFCPDRTKFVTFSEIEAQDVRTADGSTVSAIGRGDVKIDLPFGKTHTTVTLKNTLYTPKMALTLISTTRMASAGFAVHFESKMCKIMSPLPDRKVIATIPQIGGLYSIAASVQHEAHVAKLTVSDLHRALGHVAQPAVIDAVRNGLIEGVELDSTSIPEFCVACTKAKAVRQSFPAESKNRSTKYGAIIHTDLWGPAQTASLSGSLYYMSFTDDYSRETKVRFLKLKSEAFAAFKDYDAQLARQHPDAKIRTLRSDRGGEYLSAEFSAYLKERGIVRQLTVHDSPQQNGVAERLNRTLVEHARAMLLGKDMPMYLWAEAIQYATWLKNRFPSRAIPGYTPHALVYKTKPNLGNAHEFGCKVYVHTTDGGKLEARASEAIFVGIDEQSKGFRIYWPHHRKVSVERNVVFEPLQPRKPAEVMDEGEYDAVEHSNGRANGQSIVHPVPQTHSQASVQPSAPPKTPPASPAPLPAPTAPRITRTRQPPGYYRALNEGQQASSAIAVTSDIEHSSIHWALAAAEAEPTLREALSGPDGPEWQAAVDYEIAQLEKLEAWKVVTPPHNANIIPCHFILATKRGPDGEKLKLRARLVTNGQRQKHGIDYAETFAPTTNMTTIRTVLCIAAHRDWEIHQIDVKSAYLNAQLHDDIYMRAPPGYLKSADLGKVLKLLRSLYGLKQAGFEWSEELERFFLDAGYTRSQVDQAVYFRRISDEHTVITVSVDDMAITSRHIRHIDRFKAKLRERFEITDLGELTWLLGLKVERDRSTRTISLSQQAYVGTVLERFHLEDATSGKRVFAILAFIAIMAVMAVMAVMTVMTKINWINISK